MLTNTHRWSHTRGNTVVPYRWQATLVNPRPVCLIAVLFALTFAVGGGAGDDEDFDFFHQRQTAL